MKISNVREVVSITLTNAWQSPSVDPCIVQKAIAPPFGYRKL
jgi:hypothetical protein